MPEHPKLHDSFTQSDSLDTVTDPASIKQRKDGVRQIQSDNKTKLKVMTDEWLNERKSKKQ